MSIEQSQDNSKWWYVKNGERNGPYSVLEMNNFIRDGVITKKTSVWSVGTIDWIDAEASLFRDTFNVPVIQNDNTWWYVRNGERKGPHKEHEMNELIRTGVIEQKTPIWCNGTVNWIDADASIFRGAFCLPPPVLSESIDNRFVWALAVVPLTASIFLYGLFPVNVIVSIILNILFWSLDNKALKKSGYNVSNWMYTGLFLIPVYLFIRASRMGKKYGYAICWCILFIVSLFI